MQACRHAPAGLPEQPFQDGVEGCLGVAGRDRGGRRERRCVVVDPRVAGEVADSGPAGQQRRAVAGHRQRNLLLLL